MNLEQLASIGELVGSVGVIISLVYLAIQIRAQIAESRRTVIYSLTEQWLTLMAEVVESPDFAGIWLKGLNDLGSLESDEKLRFGSLPAQLCQIAQSLRVQYLEGNLDDETWQAFERRVADVMRSPGARSWWPARKHWFTSDLQSYFNELTEEFGDFDSYEIYTADKDA